MNALAELHPRRGLGLLKGRKNCCAARRTKRSLGTHIYRPFSIPTRYAGAIRTGNILFGSSIAFGLLEQAVTNEEAWRVIRLPSGA